MSDFEKAMQRPMTFFKLSSQEQWAIDESLGILDWNGDCPHAKQICKECKALFSKRFGLGEKKVEKKAEKPPNPGSDEAKKKGCLCPVLDNSHGKGYLGMKGTFVISGGCPLHGKGAKEAKRDLHGSG